MNGEAELQAAIQGQLRRLGWRLPGPGGTPGVFTAESTCGRGRFRLLVHCLPAAGPWLFYRGPAKIIARPEPLAGIIPLALASCNVPFRSQVFVRRHERTTFQYTDEGFDPATSRDLLPLIAPAAGRLRRFFLDDYLGRLTAEGRQGNHQFHLPLLVTEAPLLTLQPDEAAVALACNNPAEMAWESGYVPLFLPPHRLGQLAATAAVPDLGGREGVLTAGGPSFAFRLRYLLGQLPGIYWVVAADHLEESLRFILSYANRWHS